MPKGTHREIRLSAHSHCLARPWAVECQPVKDYSDTVRAVTFSVTGGLATPPTVTTTGCGPVGAVEGIVKSICVTPAAHDGMPMVLIVAGIPPTVRVTGRRGCQRKSKYATPVSSRSRAHEVFAVPPSAPPRRLRRNRSWLQDRNRILLETTRHVLDRLRCQLDHRPGLVT